MGSHFPSNIGVGAIFYDGADQITLEEVSKWSFHLFRLRKIRLETYRIRYTDTVTLLRSLNFLSTLFKLQHS